MSGSLGWIGAASLILALVTLGCGAGSRNEPDAPRIIDRSTLATVELLNHSVNARTAEEREQDRDAFIQLLVWSGSLEDKPDANQQLDGCLSDLADEVGLDALRRLEVLAWMRDCMLGKGWSIYSELGQASE